MIGGILICGKTSTNHPGGEAALEGGIADQTTKRGFFGGGTTPDDNDNSGVLEYVRIEFAGIAAAPNQELNSLTLGAVGRGTIINHVQVSYANDDAYEWFGGTVDAKYLIATGTLDDDLDCDNGYSGRVQFALIQRHKDRADVSTSEAFEIDNNSSGSYAEPLTKVIFSNITAIGPLQDTSWSSSSTGVADKTYHTRFGPAAQIRRNARASIFNSVIFGWPRGLELLSAQGQAAAAADSLMFRNNNVYGIKGDLLRRDGTNPVIPANWLETSNFNNVIDVSTPNTAKLTNPFVIGLGFNPTPLANAQYLNDAKFDNGNSTVNIADGFFEKVSYRGAFNTEIANRWDLPWAEYDPVNKDYITSVEDEYIWQLGINIYPNPTSESASIVYQIPNNDVVTIKIYDQMGNLVDTIVENIVQAQGFYEFSINASNLSSGTYFVRVITNNGATTKNLNIIK